MAVAKKSKKKKAKAKLTPEQKAIRKIQQGHKRSARSVFRNIGFERVSSTSDKPISFDGRDGDFDDIFVLENLIVITEYTAANASGAKDHLQKKKLLFNKVAAKPKELVKYLRGRFLSFDDALGEVFHEDDLEVRIVYCSRYDVDEATKALVQEAIYLDFPELKYFEKLAAAVRYSARHELYEFLNLQPGDVAEGGIFLKETNEPYRGSMLPEKSSGFKAGYKVVSFYVDADALLRRAFVLRRDGWRGTFQAYQRMIIPAKIEAIRKKLRLDKQVFVNNLIATLPDDVHPLDSNNKTVDISKLTESEPVTISLPLRANSIGLIDGQHRLFSYYEKREDDDALIAKLRHQQNLLVTGIIYPANARLADRERFEAALFLAINSNQTNAPPALRQEIEVLLTPSSPIAIGRQVMQRLAKTGPLTGFVENYFFDKGKLKTTSIVSYGLGPLIKLSGGDSLFKLFKHPEKDLIEKGASKNALDACLAFATTKINILLGAVRDALGPTRWTTNSNVEDRALSVTYVNAYLITLRHLIEAGWKIDHDTLSSRLKGIGAFPFSDYHSSQYGRMAEEIFKKHFGGPPPKKKKTK